MSAKLTLSLLPDILAVCRLQPDGVIPPWSLAGGFSSITRTSEELSIVCSQGNVPEGTRCETGWRCFKVEGPLDFSLTGILASLLGPLAQAGIGVFTLSTYDTDYILVRETQVSQAVEVLSLAGHLVLQQEGGS